MFISSHITLFPTPLCHLELGDNYLFESQLTENTVRLEAHQLGELVSYQISTNGLCLLDTHMSFMQPAYDHFSIDSPCITVSFFFQGDSLSEVPPFSAQQFRGNTHNMRYLPRLRARFQMPAQEQLNY